MSSPKNQTRWETLSQEAHAMEKAMSSFTLLGVMDREDNHLASMQDEIDSKVRHALVTYWLTLEQSNSEQDIV